MTETWADIAGYEGHYQVSTFGNVRSIKKGICILKGDCQPNGYRRVYLWLNGSKKNLLVHRLVAETFIDNPENCTDVNHLDEDKTNNNVANLEWCSHLYNMNYGSVKQKISDANKGRIISEEKRRKYSIETSKRRWINDGRTERYVYFYEVDNYIADGWKAGRLKKGRDSNVRKGQSWA